MLLELKTHSPLRYFLLGINQEKGSKNIFSTSGFQSSGQSPLSALTDGDLRVIPPDGPAHRPAFLPPLKPYPISPVPKGSGELHRPRLCSAGEGLHGRPTLCGPGESSPGYMGWGGSHGVGGSPLHSPVPPQNGPPSPPPHPTPPPSGHTTQVLL